MSVRRCQDEVSSAEFGEWLAYWQIEAAAGETEEPDDEEFAAKMNRFMVASNAARKG